MLLDKDSSEALESKQKENGEWVAFTVESLETLSPKVKDALSYSISAALSFKDGQDQKSIEEIVEEAVSRCQDIVLEDDVNPGSTVVDILNGISILAESLRLENLR